MSTAFIIPPWAQPKACYAVIVTPPEEEPITVEEGKLLAAMTWAVTVPPDPRDQMVADFISAAREKVERDTGLALLSQVRDLHILDYADWVPLPSQCTPVTDIMDVTPIVNPLAATTPRPAMRARLERRQGITGLWFDPLDPQPIPVAPVETVLRVTAGWPDAATLKAEAPLLHHAVGLLTAHYLTLGRDLAITGAVAAVNTVPETYEESIQPYRLVWVA